VLLWKSVKNSQRDENRYATLDALERRAHRERLAENHGAGGSRCCGLQGCCQLKSFEEDGFEKAQAKAQAKRTAVTSLQPAAAPEMIAGTPIKDIPAMPNQAGTTGVTRGEKSL